MPSSSRTPDGVHRRDRVDRRMPIARRTALKGLALGLGWLGVGWPAVAGGTTSSALSGPDRALAELGARFARERPALARRLADDVERTLVVGHRRNARVASLARRARAACLAPGRTRDELARGDVVLVDGWMLARSEAALAAYLHRLGV